ncbi:MAG: ABC transporter ATP-binding protein [Deltaproteobacteria bacterium]|nr:ABC transporter ATP-binding protein [Deltaproteobacteria bacterium]
MPAKEKALTLIELKNVHFTYPGGIRVLSNLDFKLGEGEKVGLIGPNGSGKTTLFHIIMGLLKPDSGRITIFGRECREEKDFKTARREIGLLFQDPDDQLFSPTVLEDLAFGPLNQGKSVREAKRIARGVLEMLGLSGFEDRITYKLSGGEKKLVALGTILAMKPRVLLLDEPTTALDPETTERIIQILKEIDVSYVFISHNMDFLLQMADKIYGMENGRLILEEDSIPHTHVHVHPSGRIQHTHSGGDMH